MVKKQGKQKQTKRRIPIRRENTTYFIISSTKRSTFGDIVINYNYTGGRQYSVRHTVVTRLTRRVVVVVDGSGPGCRAMR